MQDVINQARSKKLSSARIGKASYCALRMDKIDIQESMNSGSGIPVEFIANEFLGNKTIYFFKTNCGHICEVEEHMSLTPPRSLSPNREYYLNFGAQHLLLYDENNLLIK